MRILRFKGKQTYSIPSRAAISSLLREYDQLRKMRFLLVLFINLSAAAPSAFVLE